MGKVARKRILIVDDDEFIRDVCSLALTKAGHEVAVTADGIEAMEMLKGSAYDLVITDLEMPGLDGIGLYLSTLRDFPCLAEKFFFMTGRLSQNTQSILSRLNKKYILKPFNVKDFLSHVEMLLPRA